MSLRALLLASVLAAAPAATLHAQTIVLSAAIGSPGTDAQAVAGIGNIVNATGYAFDSGATALIAPGSSGASSFDFNTGFSDSLDRSSGSSAGAGHVFVDLKYDSASTAPLVLDTDNNGSFLGESAQTGFGLHGDTFITFDLNALRTTYGVSPGASFVLTGSTGVANYTGYGQTSAAIIVDGTQRAVFDWVEGTSQFSSFSLTISSTAQYLTFIGLSGLDLSNWGAHVGFIDVQLLSIPEPGTFALLASGGLGAALLAWRRRRA